MDYETFYKLSDYLLFDVNPLAKALILTAEQKTLLKNLAIYCREDYHLITEKEQLGMMDIYISLGINTGDVISKYTKWVAK